MSGQEGSGWPGWSLTLRAALLLPLVELGLALAGLARVRRWLGRGLSSPAEGSAEACREEAEAADRAVRRVARITRSRCLARSLVLQRLLARQGIAAEVRIGVRKDAGTLAAHAWVEVAGRPLGEPEEIPRRFATLR